MQDRTDFSAGVVAEIFTAESFGATNEATESDCPREHLTLCYHDQSEQFSVANFIPTVVYNKAFIHHRTDPSHLRRHRRLRHPTPGIYFHPEP